MRPLPVVGYEVGSKLRERLFFRHEPSGLRPAGAITFRPVCFDMAVVILVLAVTHSRRLSMEKESSSKRCCCINNICKKMDDESACAKMGGKMVDSCTVCHY
jgi:hypothetical protein